MSAPLASVIIPTHNRPDALDDALEALAMLPPDEGALEVIVVDDGSTDDYAPLRRLNWTPAVRWRRQAGGGATVARNFGAKEARGEVLIFMDDDIVPAPPTIRMLAQHVQDNVKTIALGTLITKPPPPGTPYVNRLIAQERNALATEQSRTAGTVLEIPPTRCLTGLLAIRRSDFETLSGFQDPTGGWPNWDDVDFGVRAARAGFRLERLTDALAEHRDRTVADLASASERYRRAARSAVRLFRRYPDLQAELPMFYDMTPIIWRRDSPRLVARKVLRRMSATKPSRAVLTGLAGWLEHRAPHSALLDTAYRWAVGAAICIGYREGQRADREGTAA